MNEEENSKLASNGFAWAILGGPFLYFLSIGPVGLLVTETHAGTEVIEWFYAPIIWLHHHTLLKEPLESYLAWWGAH